MSCIRARDDDWDAVYANDDFRLGVDTCKCGNAQCVYNTRFHDIHQIYNTSGNSILCFVLHKTVLPPPITSRAHDRVGGNARAVSWYKSSRLSYVASDTTVTFFGCGGDDVGIRLDSLNLCWYH